jgi:sulfite reductase (NADPH) hemoprotein beta-component
MYRYTEFDRQFVHQRAAQFRDQLRRHLAGELPDDDFRALRLQNGWYVQRHAPMLRVAVPYGELSSKQLRALGRIAREYDARQGGPYEDRRGGYGHFTTRQNCQYNWIALADAADVMDILADADMHGIQTSGNCIRNITSDCFAGVAADEIVDPRPYCEILRQWSTLHPEFAFLPRKFKIAVSGTLEDRAATAWHDIGLVLKKNDAGEIGFEVRVGGGMGRTPIIGTVIRDFLPWKEILVFIEAIVRVYNRYGRRDNSYKARIKILVKAEGQKFIDAVDSEFANIREHDVDGGAHLLTDAELARVSAGFELVPEGVTPSTGAPVDLFADADARGPAYRRWLERNVHPHRIPGYRAVTLSLKRAGLAPGDATADQMDAAAALADRFSLGELRVSHDQNLVLPWIRESELAALWEAARAEGFATPNIGYLTDMIACPGGDLCALANARSLPIAAAINERFDDLDELHDIGDIDLHISGCINSCGHHHSGHIGILGVDKDGKEWYQVSLGGMDGSALSGGAAAGKVIGPSFAADEVPDVIEAVIDAYRGQRSAAAERFIDTVKRVGLEPFRTAANAVRRATAVH